MGTRNERARNFCANGKCLTIALLSTALPYILYFRILAAAGAPNLLLVTFLMPIGSILLGATIGLVAIDGRPLAAIRQVWRRAWAAS